MLPRSRISPPRSWPRKSTAREERSRCRARITPSKRSGCAREKTARTASSGQPLNCWPIRLAVATWAEFNCRITRRKSGALWRRTPPRRSGDRRIKVAAVQDQVVSDDESDLSRAQERACVTKLRGIADAAGVRTFRPLLHEFIDRPIALARRRLKAAA